MGIELTWPCSETVYCNGEQHAKEIAMRLINRGIEFVYDGNLIIRYNSAGFRL